MTSNYVLIGITVGVFVAGMGIGYAIFMNTYNPYSMMMQPQFFNQWMSQNPQYVGQWMGYMMSDPQLRQQMYDNMLQNQQFMYGMMSNSNFQNNYMHNWLTSNNYTWHGMMGNINNMMRP